MAIVEKEGLPLQNRDYRQHLNRNWDNINGFEKTVNRQIEQVLSNPPAGTADELTQLRIDTQGNEYPLAKPRIDSIERDASYASKEVVKKADKDYINNYLSQISYSPETVASLDELKSKYPNGKPGLFITADNGHKYIWSNNAWTDAGIYQSVGVADDSISANKVKANISPGFIVNDGNTVPNFNLTTGQLEINSSLNVSYKGNIVSNYKFYPSVLDLPERCSIYFNVKSATFFTGSNYSDDDVAVGGRLGNNCFLNGQYTVDGKSPYPDRAPSYDIYSVDDSLGTWDIGNNKIDLNNIYINFDQTSVNIQKRTIDLVDRGTKYLYLSGTNLIAENPPLSTDGRKIYLGWLNGYRKVYHLSSSFELKIAGASQNITNYVTSVADTIAMGDSITFGLHATDPTTGSWPALLSKNVGVNVFNEGASSATWQNGSDDDTISFVNRAKSIDWTQANDIILFGGTNDFAQDLPIGKVDDDFDETLLGAMNNTLKAIYASNAKANIMLITPMWRSRINAGSVDVETTPNGIGLYLRDYVDAVKLIGDKYHIPVLDLYHEFNVNSLNFSTWLADGLHPNDAGYARLAEKIAKFIMISK